MKNRFAEMDCYLLAGGKDNPTRDLKRDGDMTRLEKGYRQYAKLFEKVTLVLKEHQATVPYVNYPHVCDEEASHGAVVGVKTALQESESDAVFIGSTDIVDFPLELIFDLVSQYDGQPFLGYAGWINQPDHPQPLFGVFNKSLARRLESADQTIDALRDLLVREGTFLPLPSTAL